ncbi:DUF2937 family protein [Halomonas denitrificans]
MGWVGRRMDHLGSAAFGGAGGLGFSQAPAFTQAYLQRLGGHVDEAQRTIEKIRQGELLPWLAPDGRATAIAELQVRLDQLLALQAQLRDTPPLLRPLTLLRRGEWSIAERAAGDFVPAIPLDPASLTWTGIGIVVAVIAYELLCRAPIGGVRWYRNRRQADANGAAVRAKRSR